MSIQHTSGRDPQRADEQPLAIKGEHLLREVEAAAEVLCKRWKPGILWLLATGHQRYNELQHRLPGVTPKMLTQQLRELERDGLVVRQEHEHGPKHVEYALTEIGEGMRPVLESLEVWGRKYQSLARARREQDRERTREPSPGARPPGDARKAAGGGASAIEPRDSHRRR